MKKNLFFVFCLMSFVFAQEQFNLEECLQYAMENNPDLTIANLDVTSAEAGITGSYSGILPSLSSGLNYNHRNQGQSEYFFEGEKVIQSESSSNSYDFGLRYNQTLYDGGGWWNEIKLAKNKYKNAIAAQRQTKQNLKAFITQQYYSILKAKKLLGVYESSLKTSKQQLKKTKEMFELGQVAKKDYLKARVQEGNDKLNIIQQKNTIASLKNELASMMGYKNNNLEIVEKEYEVPRRYQEENVLTRAMDNNIELQNLEFQKKSAQLQFDIARSYLLPILSTNMSYSRGGSEPERVYSDFDKYWNTSIGLNLSIPIFQGFSTRTNIQQTRINYEQYDSRITKKKLDIRQRVKNIIDELKAYDEMLEINQLNLESAEEDLRSAQEMYRLKSATMLEVLDAQANLTQAKANLISTKYNAKIAEVNLKYLVGTI